MYKIFDTHLHLDLINNKAEVIKEIEDNEIYTIAVTNLPVLFMKLNNELSSKYIRPALGLHPELLYDYKHHIPQMWEHLNKTRYIGEVGIDLHKGKDYKNLQISFFTELVSRCNEYGNKILSVHSRGSADEIVSIIGDDFSGKAILHWYSGNKTTLKEAVSIGLFFSVNYSMVKSKSGRDLVRMIPLDRLLLETDAPFIKFDNRPFSILGIKNIIEELGLIFEMSTSDISTVLWNNFKRLITE